MDTVFLPNGDMALSVQIGNEISIETSRRVNAFKQALEAEHIPGIVELLPTYCAVMIHYRPELILYQQLVDICKERLSKIDLYTMVENVDEMVLSIPVLYGGEWGFDLPEVAAFHKMTEQEIIDIHTGYLFYSYMLGFTPGHAYLGSDNPLRMPRRQSPRAKVDRGCVVVMNNQSVIEPIDSPNGWNVIGKTPVQVFDITKEDPFIIKAGMWLKFESIDRPTYDAIETQVKAGIYKCQFIRRAKGL